MIDDLVSSIATSLISQGGGWVIAVLLGIVIYIMDKRLAEAKSKSDMDTKETYEKRLTEFRELLDVIGSSTQAINTMQVSVTASREATNGLTQAFAKLMREFESHQDLWENRSASFTKQLDDIQRRVEYLQKGHVS